MLIFGAPKASGRRPAAAADAGDDDDADGASSGPRANATQPSAGVRTDALFAVAQGPAEEPHAVGASVVRAQPPLVASR